MKILIVDDSAQNRKLLAVLLRDLGYETIEAENGIEAVLRAREEGVQLIIMDLIMPEMDGLSALQAIRRDEATKGIPVVALTASALRGQKEYFIGEGFDDYITKPIELDVFIQSIKKHMER